MPGGAPKKDGPNIAVIALIAVVVLAVSGLGGCIVCWAVARSRGGASATNDPQKAVESGQSTWITAERPPVKFISPPSWTKNVTGDWGVFRSPDSDAVLAYTTFNQPGESTAKLSQAASVLGVTNVGWGSPRWDTVGKERFRAHTGDGTCNFKGPNGYIWYATVNTGTPDQILIIYAVTAKADKRDKEQALASIHSLQRR